MNGIDDAPTVRTRYWHALPDGRVQCDLCPRYCQLKEGQRGFCFVRACQDGEVVLTTFGRASSALMAGFIATAAMNNKAARNRSSLTGMSLSGY